MTETLDAKDQELIEAAREVMRRNFVADRYTVAAAVRTASGKVYTGVDVETTGYGPCAEPVAIGTAATQGEREFVSIVAVAGGDPALPVLAPCGNCRQLLADYAPEAMVILPEGGALVKARARDLLPLAYRRFPAAEVPPPTPQAAVPEVGPRVEPSVELKVEPKVEPPVVAPPARVGKAEAIEKANMALTAAKRARAAGVDVTEIREILREARTAFEAKNWEEAARLSDEILRRLAPRPAA